MVSIGNLTVGGTGKTPMTQWLCRRLQAEGKRVAILSRGHGGDSQSVRLVSDGDGSVFLTADEAGDEPALLARTLCRASRFSSAKTAVNRAAKHCAASGWTR